MAEFPNSLIIELLIAEMTEETKAEDAPADDKEADVIEAEIDLVRSEYTARPPDHDIFEMEHSYDGNPQLAEYQDWVSQESEMFRSGVMISYKEIEEILTDSRLRDTGFPDGNGREFEDKGRERFNLYKIMNMNVILNRACYDLCFG